MIEVYLTKFSESEIIFSLINLFLMNIMSLILSERFSKIVRIKSIFIILNLVVGYLWMGIQIEVMGVKVFGADGVYFLDMMLSVYTVIFIISLAEV